jgi:NADH-quinone oxidoreductase subunit M
MNAPILSIITFLPLAGALLLIFINKDKENLLRTIALILTLVIFVISLSLYINFDDQNPDPQFVEKSSWIGYGINYHIGIDGISLFLVLLTTLLMPIAILSSWKYIGKRVKEYLIFMLLLETGIIGVFVALNLFLFYVFWEITLVPMYFLIGIWGGKRRIYATIKYVLFTMFGSLLMLVAIFFLYSMYYKATGVYSFNIFDMYKLVLNPSIQVWLFLAFALAFAIKVPSTNSWISHPCSCAPKNGGVWFSPVRHATLPRRFNEIPSIPGSIGSYWDYLWGFDGPDTEGRQITRGILECQPYGTHHVGYIFPEYGRYPGGHLSNAQPRIEYGRAVLVCRYPV